MTLPQKISQTLHSFPSTSDSPQLAWVAHYLGTTKTVLGIRSAEIKKLSRQFLSEISSQDEFFKIIGDLYQHGQTYEELALAATIFNFGKIYRKNFDPQILTTWLGYTQGWAEVDSLCQSAFTGEEQLSNWSHWKKYLVDSSHSQNIQIRRASLVLLNKPLRTSDSENLSDLAFIQINTLRSEKEILITKAISWLLRSLVKYHSPKLHQYLSQNQQYLPKIAYREAMKKLTTGKKS